MKGNVKNGDRKKKEKMENLEEFVWKNRENKRRKMRKKKRNFLLKYEKESIREKANTINLSDKKKIIQ